MIYKLIKKFDGGGQVLDRNTYANDELWFQAIYDEYKRNPQNFNLSNIIKDSQTQQAFHTWISEKEGTNELPELTVLGLRKLPSVATQVEDLTTVSTTVTDDNKTSSPYLFTPVLFYTTLLPEPPEKELWSDWLPYSTSLALEQISASKLAALKKKLKFPLEEAPYLQHLVTNNYALRTGLLQQANELRALGQLRGISSDIDQNLRTIRDYDFKASEIENQAELLKAQKFAEEAKIAEDNNNRNKLASTEVNNFNIKENANAFNNIIEADAQKDLRKTKARQDYIDKITTSYGQSVSDNKLNDQAYIRGLNEYLASKDQLNFYNDYIKIANAGYKESLAYTDFINYIENSGQGPGKTQVDIEGFDYDLYENPETKEAYLKQVWEGNIGRPYRELFEKEKQDAENRYLMAILNIQNRLLAANLAIKSRVNNLGIYFRPSYVATYQPIYGYAKGGSVRARFIDYHF